MIDIFKTVLMNQGKKIEIAGLNVKVEVYTVQPENFDENFVWRLA